MPKTLLLADDSVTIQKVVGLSFASEDVVLVTVSNGDDAIARARELRPDLVLADVVMPGKNGYEVCEAVKTDPALRHIPVLLLTGTFEAFDQERARRAGADGHVTKPFEAQALVQQVRSLMERPPQPVVAEAAPAFDVPTLPPVPQAATATLATPFSAPSATPGDPFFENDLDEVTRFADAPLDLDPEAAAGELELATVAEDDDLLEGVHIVSGTETFRGSPLFAPERSGTDLFSPRAMVPMPANVLPDDAFDLDDDSLPFAAPAATTPPTAPAVAYRFDEDDSAGDTVLDPGRAEGYDLSFADLDDPLATARGEVTAPPQDAPRFVPDPAPITPLQAAAATDPGATSTSSPGLPVDLSPALRQRLHDTLEKVAWEAFADLSDTIVRQALERVESIAWEVIPQLAEQLIREEIRRMKGDDEAK